jgi:glutathione S-transferase
MLDGQLAKSGGPFLSGKNVSIIDVASFAYTASAYWACVDILEMKHLSKWLTILHGCPSFKTGSGIPFRQLAFFGPLWATEEEIQAEIQMISAQFQIKKD